MRRKFWHHSISFYFYSKLKYSLILLYQKIPTTFRDSNFRTHLKRHNQGFEVFSESRCFSPIMYIIFNYKLHMYFTWQLYASIRYLEDFSSLLPLFWPYHLQYQIDQHKSKQIPPISLILHSWKSLQISEHHQNHK